MLACLYGYLVKILDYICLQKWLLSKLIRMLTLCTINVFSDFLQ